MGIAGGQVKTATRRLILGRLQLGVAVIGVLGLIASLIYAFSAAGSCFGLGCTASLVAFAASIFFLALALLAIPAYGWLRGRPWARLANAVALIPLIVVVYVAMRIAGDLR